MTITVNNNEQPSEGYWTTTISMGNIGGYNPPSEKVNSTLIKEILEEISKLHNKLNSCLRTISIMNKGEPPGGYGTAKIGSSRRYGFPPSEKDNSTLIKEILDL